MQQQTKNNTENTKTMKHTNNMKIRKIHKLQTNTKQYEQIRKYRKR